MKINYYSKIKALLLLSVGLFTVSQTRAAHVLITEFDYNDANNPYGNIASALTATGNTNTLVDCRTGGALAAALASGSYDQVYLYDLTASLYLNSADTSSLASFWSSHQGLVVDGRSYGYYFQGTNTSEVHLIQNVASNFDLTGGGVWVGTDDNPTWANNADAFLNAIGVNNVSGAYSNPVNYADPSSVLLSGVTPTSLWGGGQTVAAAPTGLQPNGITMYEHFGSTDSNGNPLAYISASFPLKGPTSSVPDGGATLSMLGLALIGLAGFRRKQSK